MVGRLGVNPELEHAARRVEGAHHGAGRQLAYIADIDDLHLRVGESGLNLGDRISLDLRHGFIDKDAESCGDWHAVLLEVDAVAPG